MSDIVLSEDAQAASLFDGDSFADGYAIVGGGRLVQEKDWLIGVPHVITKVTFYVPELNSGMVTLEATVGTQGMIDKQLKYGEIAVLEDNGQPKLDALEEIVYNDGGTGIRRQVVALLEKFELIKIKSKLPEAGGMGESRYDLDWSKWEFSQTTTQGEHSVPCFTEMHNGKPFRLAVPRGLQSSDGGKNRPKDAKPTFYLR